VSNNNQEPVWNLYGFDEPQKIETGTSFDGEPVYFDCCDCGEEDAVLAGYMATTQTPTRNDLAFWFCEKLQEKRPAFFCQKCWDKLLTESESGMIPE
jgi:hypothetical protein